VNLYRYVFNSSPNFIDPDGLIIRGILKLIDALKKLKPKPNKKDKDKDKEKHPVRPPPREETMDACDCFCPSGVMRTTWVNAGFPCPPFIESPVPALNDDGEFCWGTERCPCVKR